MMKKITIVLIMLLSVGFLQAQVKGTKSLNKKILPQEKTKQNKGESIPYLSREEARCNVVMKSYKILLKHILHKDENETLDINSLMPTTRVKFNANLTPDLYFRKVGNTSPFPMLGTHFVQQPNGVYPVAVEMVSYLHQQNGSNSILGFTYEEGNYNDVVEVMDVFKTGTQTYIKIRRSNGVIQDIRFYPGHSIDGCEIQEN